MTQLGMQGNSGNQGMDVHQMEILQEAEYGR